MTALKTITTRIETASIFSPSARATPRGAARQSDGGTPARKCGWQWQAAP